MSHFMSWEMEVPTNLNDSTAVTVLFMMVSRGRAGGFLLKSMIISTVLSVLSSRLLRLHQTASSSTSCLKADSSPFWMRPISVVSSANFRSFDGGVFKCAVIRVEGEAQWGEDTALRSSSGDRAGAGYEFYQPH